MTHPRISRAYYAGSIQDFLSDNEEKILGRLTIHHNFSLDETQRNAWIAQIRILKQNLRDFKNGYIFFEYAIPRMGKRVDTVFITHGIVFVIEFKVGDSSYSSYALDQVLDYALDLKNFHEQSHDKPIIPILVATEARMVENKIVYYEDRVYQPVKVNKDTIGQTIKGLVGLISGSSVDPILWENSLYKPTPTIIEAAQSLYQGHSVTEITRSDAGAINLSRTSEAISKIIEKSKTEKRKAICFVTGVPGAGKTLAGLNIANERLKVDEDEHAVFLSGNGPLVKVLREALARNEVEASVLREKGITKKKALSKAEAFIQNIHHFRDDALSVNHAPIEKVVVFDEAQRAWTLKQTASFMQNKKGVPNFSMSEPEFLISVMDRHEDWSVIIALIGGGQEINTGEAGLLEWFKAIKEHYPHWQIYASSKLSDYEYTRGKDLSLILNPRQLCIEDDLHLSVSVRSYRSEKVSEFIKSLLDCDKKKAAALYCKVNDHYPIVITRDLEKAKNWLKSKARGTERFGLLASSGGYRLKPFGINIQAKVDVINWFLNGKDDVRSSYFLEDVATEFDIQGLELDWTCVAWDADLSYQGSCWISKNFRGTRWQYIRDETRKLYLKNAYRVLLTRARQGMVIFIPYGSEKDKTRLPKFYDGTYNYLKEIGLNSL